MFFIPDQYTITRQRSFLFPHVAVKVYLLSLSILKLILEHAPTFLSAVMTCLGTSLAVVNVVSLTLLSASITDICTQITKLLCKLAVHRHQGCGCPTNSSTLSVHLSTACHHPDIVLFEVRRGTEFTGFSAAHTGIYAALPFCILKSRAASHKSSARSYYLQLVYRSYKIKIQRYI